MMKLKRKERARDVKGYEGLYAITTIGRVWSYRRNKWIKTWTDDNGYSRVTFCVERKEVDFRLHRLVGMAFVENPDNKPQINHINGKKSDCRACNLEWVTARENLQHAADMQLNKTYKLSYHEKELICQIHHTFGTKLTKLAMMFGVTVPAISYILKEYMPILGIV